MSVTCWDEIRRSHLHESPDSDGSTRGDVSTSSLGGSPLRGSQRSVPKTSDSTAMCDQGEQYSNRGFQLRQSELCPRYIMNGQPQFIPDRSQPGLTMTAPTFRQWDVGDKYATIVAKIKKLRARKNISVETWNVRTLRPARKLEELTHGTDKYHWNILGFCEMRWKKTLVRCLQLTDTRFISVE